LDKRATLRDERKATPNLGANTLGICAGDRGRRQYGPRASRCGMGLQPELARPRHYGMLKFYYVSFVFLDYMGGRGA